MIILFKLVLLTSIWCLGIKIITAKGMGLSNLGDYGLNKVGEGKWVFDPLIVCEFCLPSIHSLFGYAFAVGIGVITHFSWSLVFMLPFVIAGSSIISGLVWNSYLTMVSIKNRNEAEEDYYDSLCDEQEFINEYQNHN